ncbi:24295_t:CDS:2 [Dentiscutata erythropus]|uniref:24295_t:CDS:1 n=1 Tax=Dentiscutata erythropus TaxID=1348616 RepID=A0A9N8YUE5_9GLOM|nr:24295_t:CDS:2 [Dentiscutata erythropus]
MEGVNEHQQSSDTPSKCIKEDKMQDILDKVQHSTNTKPISVKQVATTDNNTKPTEQAATSTNNSTNIALTLTPMPSNMGTDDQMIIDILVTPPNNESTKSKPQCPLNKPIKQSVNSKLELSDKPEELPIDIIKFLPFTLPIEDNTRAAAMGKALRL